MGTSVISNPPYNMPWSVPGLASFMPQYTGYTIPPKSNANFAFVLTALNMVDDKAVFLLPNGCLSTTQKEELAIKKELLRDNLLSAVISLPDSMFESTGIPVCIMVFQKHRQTKKIMMIDMRDSFETEEREQNGQFGGNSHTGRTYKKKVNVIPEPVMIKAIEAINGLKDIESFSRAVAISEIEQNDYILTPSRYISLPTAEIKHRPFEDITNDYNRIMMQKNAIQIRFNRTAAKRLGFDCMDHEAPDLTDSFAIVGQKPVKGNYVHFSASDGIEIKCSTKDGIHPLVVMFLSYWKQYIIYLNDEENRCLAEFRDALLPELMAGRIDINGKENE